MEEKRITQKATIESAEYEQSVFIVDMLKGLITTLVFVIDISVTRVSR